MRTSHLILSVLLLGFLFGCQSPQRYRLFVVSHNQDPVNLRMRPYQANANGFVPKETPPDDMNYVDFFVTFFNNTAYPVYQYEDQFSLGYDSLEIELRKKDGTLYYLTKKEGTWYRNYPSLFVIPAHSLLAYPVSLDPSIWNGLPQILPGELYPELEGGVVQNGCLPAVSLCEEIWVRAKLLAGFTEIDGKMHCVNPSPIMSGWVPITLRMKNTAHIAKEKQIQKDVYEHDY